ncbi:helix-turn-helix domain-containing protein [Anoxybacillus sp. J5B_2022]|uniref:helix-turn-helix domain-containing protein n=1 Tax=Anoxybacillus sp. J5B_2022 TaxID=3003246 RepID=UPI0022859E46|nr:helix-turn-helix domain-containing protein [Anoxybacillus sp. J5B_2022]MCZ0754533.1 helix-turn-helix domain-containing protein [Anoxybacillus sp. J5B_2022]
MLPYLLLYCLHRFNGERSLAAVYHLLSGKKSAQTLQDSKWFQLEHVFGVCKTISLLELEQTAQELLMQKWIVSIDERSYMLTEAGRRELEQWLPSARFFAHLNGSFYHAVDTLFWYRLSLAVQTLSNLVHRYKFAPIHRHEATLAWVKKYFLSQTKPAHDLAQALYQELHALCSSLPEEEATIFTLRLTSFERIGWTNEQIALFFRKDPLYIQLMFQHLLHYMMKRIERESHLFPVLHEFVKDLVKPVSLTLSAQKTYEWLQKGKTIAEIARIRKLKRNTIEDHIVEIAANVREFSIEPFVAEETRRMIMKEATRLGTRQLKKIRDAVGHHVSYFEIRLVLAKAGELRAS